MLSVLISLMFICLFLLLSIINIFYILCGTANLNSGRFYNLGWPQSLGAFTSLTEPILFLCQHKSFDDIINVDDILVWICSKHAGGGHNPFCAHFWFFLLYTLISPSLHFTLLNVFVFLGLFWDTVDRPVSVPSDKLHAIQQLALSLCQVIQSQHVECLWFFCSIILFL